MRAIAMTVCITIAITTAIAAVAVVAGASSPVSTGHNGARHGQQRKAMIWIANPDTPHNASKLEAMMADLKGKRGAIGTGTLMAHVHVLCCTVHAY